VYGWHHLVKAREVTAGLALSNLLPGGTDSSYTGITSGPKAQYQVWENFTFYLFIQIHDSLDQPGPLFQTGSGSNPPFFQNLTFFHDTHLLQMDRSTDEQTNRTTTELGPYQQATYAICATRSSNVAVSGLYQCSDDDDAAGFEAVRVWVLRPRDGTARQLQSAHSQESPGNADLCRRSSRDPAPKRQGLRLRRHRR